MSLLTKVSIGLILLGIFGTMLQAKLHHEANVAEQVKQLEQFRTSDKPRVLEFYADWCGPCRSYGPIVDDAAKKWAGKVDFARLNVDNPESRKLATVFEVSAIPRTIFIDSNGKKVDDVTGGMDASRLEGLVSSLANK